MYYLVYGCLWLFSLLPLKVLYLFSDFAYLVIYYVAGYRKVVVMQNLRIAFPEKTEEERLRIAKNFYRNLTDTFIETIKLISADSKFVQKHIRADYSIFERLHRENKSSQVHLGHNFNWEFANLAFALNVQQPYLGVYMPLENKVMDRIFIKLRSKFGCVLLPATNMRNAILPWRNKEYILGLVADQNPGVPSRAFWVNFFNRPTPFVTGPENGARLHNLAVVFCNITKWKRGYYEIHFILEDENPAALPAGALTKNYVNFIEGTIRAHPDMWLWSHRRWKHEYKPDYGNIL